MRWVDFANRKPSDADIPGWVPWTEEQWQAWLTESKQLLVDLAALNAEALKLRDEGDVVAADAKITERNKFIDDNSPHWGKLKPWLFAISHGKCWFTEGRDICSHKDVEHFRPKKEAKDLDGSVREGYWWLAFDYGNYRACGNVTNRKKGGWFPLHAGSACSVFEFQCEENETPYLLDPTDPIDVTFIAFNEEGNAISAPGITGWEAERADESIKRYKLNEHDDLPAERRKVWREINDAIDGYRKYKSRTGAGGNVGAEQRLREQVRILKKRLREDAELSSVAKWCLLLKNDPELTKIAS